MEEKNSDSRRQKHQINALRSGNRSVVLETLKELRSSGKVFILLELFDLLVDQEDDEIISVTASLLNDMKGQEVTPLLVVSGFRSHGTNANSHSAIFNNHLT